ncbi:hypothetical protein Tco_1214197 [Tanacetum coccineum]
MKELHRKVNFEDFREDGFEEEQFSLLGSRTTGISLPNMCDRWFWSLESSGDFSVKSTRICIDDNILPKNDVPTRWVKIIPIKVNIQHLGKFSETKAPYKLNLRLVGMDIPSNLCRLCNFAAGIYISQFSSLVR